MLNSLVAFNILLQGLNSYAILKASATPIQGDSPDAIQPRQSEATPHPLDYAPNFSQDPFPPWPAVTNPDGSNISVENWRGTRLFGWKGCEPNAQKVVVETMNDFHKLANQESLWKDIDWNSQAAKDIWGHSTNKRKAIPDDVRSQIKRKSSVHFTDDIEN